MLGMSDAMPWVRCEVESKGAFVVFTAAFTPLPFKLATIAAGFTGMNFLSFMAASLAGRAAIFMIVGVLFRLFGAPIKTFIDKYLGWVTLAFVALILAGFLAISQLAGSDEEEGEPPACDTSGEMQSVAR